MTDEEIEQLLAELEQLLFDLDLDFIVVQERVLAAEGVSRSPAESRRGRQSEDMPQVDSPSIAPDAGLRSEAPHRSTQTARFKSSDAVVTPLEPRTRLAILFDLIEVATAGTLAMEQDVHQQLDELRRIAPDSSTPAFEVAAPSTPASTDRTEAWDGTVIFVDPPEATLRGQVLSPWRLATAEVLLTKTTRAQTVIDLLDELRAQAGLSRGLWLAPNDDDAWSFARGSS